MVNVLIPVNFSPYSLNAVEYVRNWSSRMPVQITLLHCQSAYRDGDEDDNQGDVEQRMNDLKVSLESTNRVGAPPVLCRYEQGYPEDILVRISKTDEPDVIVMGTKSKDETIKELLGSVTSDVIKNAKVPVLAVPDLSHLDVDSISKVLFVTDFGDADYRSLHKLIRLISPFNTQVLAVHFIGSAPDKWDKKRLEQMRTYCAETYRNHTIDFEFLSGDKFIDLLDPFIKERGIDLIAMTRRKRTLISKLFHPSIARKILFHTDVPLLVFHQ